jgi:hypothetical protein
MSDPLVPNYKKDVGRLATDRYDFEEHIKGLDFRHNADAIDVIPNLVVGSTTSVNVLEALEALASAAQPPVISDATTASKGIIQLAGDIAGVATNVVVTRIQSKPISTLTPSNGDVLTWDGYVNVWKPSAATNAFTAAGDLAGSNVLQSVVSFTGIVNSPATYHTIMSFGSVIDFVHNANPLITQDFAVGSNNTNITTIRAQSTTGTNKSGGAVVIAGGAPGPGGRQGGVKLQFTSGVPGGYPKTSLSGITTANMVQLSEVAVGRRVLSLCNPSDLTTIDMPANTGDMVMFIKNAVSVPSTGSPSNGVMLYATGGELWVKQQDGNNFSIGSIPNPSIWGDPGHVEQTRTTRSYVTSTTAATLAFSFTLPDQAATRADVIFVGKKAGSTDSAQFNMSIGYSRNGAGPVAVGSLTNADPRTSGAASGWTIPNITVSGNNLQVFTGFSAGSTIQWFVVTQLTISAG